MKTTTKLSFLASSLFGAMLLTQACSSSSSDNATPTNATGGSTSTAEATGGADNGGSTGAGDTGGATSGDTGGATSSDTGGAGGAMSTGTGGSTATTVCTLDTTKKCYPACQPINNIQFLNQCTNAACQGFDNTARGVPSPLPNVP